MDLELYTACGPSQIVARRLFGLPRDVIGHPRYALVMEGDGEGDVRILQRESSKSTTATVAIWRGLHAGEAMRMLVEALEAPDVLAALEHGQPFQVEGPALAPTTPRGAFGLALGRLHPQTRVWAAVLVF
jgi:hypothetical protein